MVQFRKSKKVGPFRFTLSNRGLSSSVGAGPLRVSRGADGKVRRTISGGGFYDTKVIGGGAGKRRSSVARPPGRFSRGEKSLIAFSVVAFGVWATEMVLAFWIWR